MSHRSESSRIETGADLVGETPLIAEIAKAQRKLNFIRFSAGSAISALNRF
jgi:hypothetical protein